ncbi:MAG: glycosyltransferase family 9 protein [Candidatus Sungbacteria bacterium]|nr:glycosyltransferase family 9 protein [Candidatus Sungbacteria bacterium]
MEFAKIIFYTLAAYFFLPYFLIAVRCRKNRLTRPERPRILLLPILRQIGDVVCSTPVFRAIKLRYPNAHLAVAIGGNTIGLLRHNPRIDKLICINDKPFKGFWGRGRFFWFLGRQKFDWVISLPPSPLHNLMLFYSFAPYRVKTVRQERSFLERLTDWFANYHILYRDHTFLPKHYLKLLEALDICESAVIKEVYAAPGADGRASEFFSRNGIRQSDTVVGMSITAGNKIKEWGDEKFIRLAREIAARHRAAVTFFGGPVDEERINAAAEKLHGVQTLKVIGVPLEDLPAYMKRLSIFIGVDTGLIYIAHALGVPLVDITGPVDWREQPPEDEQSIQVRPPPPIQPSSFVFKAPGTPAEHERALASITVEMVMGAVDALMSRAVGNSDSGKRVL